MSIMSPQVALQKFITDAAKRAAHTFWQSFSGALVLLLASSAAGLAQVDDLATAKKLLVSVGIAVVSAALSALKTTVAGFRDATYTPHADALAESDDDVQQAALLQRHPDAEIAAEDAAVTDTPTA